LGNKELNEMQYEKISIKYTKKQQLKMCCSG
jgi:hypothetical protein